MTVYPRSLRPMLAELTEHPFDSDKHLFEVKWDGVRTLAYVEDGHVALQARSGNESTHLFPELATLGDLVAGRNAVLDGEIVSFNESGRPSFNQLQHRLGHAPGSARLSKIDKFPVSYQVFDILMLGDRDLMPLPLEERRATLAEAVRPGDFVQVPDATPACGVAFFNAVAGLGLEGIVAKAFGSPYLPGRRSKSWLKIKVHRHGHFVIAGYTQGEGSRGSSFGALILGLYDAAGQLRWVGNTGGGFSDEALRAIRPLLREREIDDCALVDVAKQRGMVWVRPELVCTVRYVELTDQGRLRFPIFQGLAPGVQPRDCRL